MASLFYFPSALEREKRGRNFFSLSLDGSRQNCPFSLSFCRSLRQLFFLQSLPLFFPLSFLFLPLSPMFLIPWLLLSLLLFRSLSFPPSFFFLACCFECAATHTARADRERAFCRQTFRYRLFLGLGILLSPSCCRYVSLVSLTCRWDEVEKLAAIRRGASVRCSPETSFPYIAGGESRTSQLCCFWRVPLLCLLLQFSFVLRHRDKPGAPTNESPPSALRSTFCPFFSPRWKELEVPPPPKVPKRIPRENGANQSLSDFRPPSDSPKAQIFSLSCRSLRLLCLYTHQFVGERGRKGWGEGSGGVFFSFLFFHGRKVFQETQTSFAPSAPSKKEERGRAGHIGGRCVALILCHRNRGERERERGSGWIECGREP